jgi:16S rRNA (cytosine1402-N4)-methyltransferase
MKFAHQPVLLKEVIEYLEPQPNQNFIDCTLGGGGHARGILQKTAPLGKLLGIDLDPQAISASRENLREFQNRIILVNDNYKNLKQIIYGAGFNSVNGLLLDLGLSSFELQDLQRGFSFQKSAFLDMRFGQTTKTAADILANYTEEKLSQIFKEYGEERYAKQIAAEIVKQRKVKPITTTDQLVELIAKVYAHKPKPKNIHFATKIFQALRIEVNDELNNLREILPQALEVLAIKGRLAVISFHSLEDRIVKQYFKQEAKDCLCSAYVPVCQCHHQAKLKILTKKVITPTAEEVKNNPRARSAKLRVAIKINN